MCSVSLGFVRAPLVLGQLGNWFAYHRSSLFQRDASHACPRFKSFEEGTSLFSESSLHCPVITPRDSWHPQGSIMQLHPYRGLMPLLMDISRQTGTRWALSGWGSCRDTSLPTGDEAAGFVLRLLCRLWLCQKCHITWRGGDSPAAHMGPGRQGTEGVREESTDLSFIPDCSMAETCEIIKPKNMPDISVLQVWEKLLINCLQEVFNPGSVPNETVCGRGMKGTCTTSSLVCALLLGGPSEGDDLVPCSLSFPASSLKALQGHVATWHLLTLTQS